jgi:hypothetical protein
MWITGLHGRLRGSLTVPLRGSLTVPLRGTVGVPAGGRSPYPLETVRNRKNSKEAVSTLQARTVENVPTPIGGVATTKLNLNSELAVCAKISA